MLLFEEAEKNIRVYNYIINKEKMYHFKKREMAHILGDKRILCAVTSHKYPLVGSKKIFEYNDLNYEFGHDFHILGSYKMTNEEILRQKNYLEKYYHFLNSYGSSYQVIKSKVENVNEHFLNLNPITINGQSLYLIPTSKYNCNKTGYTVMDNILNVPESLYYLEHFMASKYTDIPEEYLLKFIKLYEQIEVKNIDIDTLKIMINYNLVKKQVLNNQIENSTRVLKLIKGD